MIQTEHSAAAFAVSRRTLLASAGPAALLAACGGREEGEAPTPLRLAAAPFPLEAVRLTPSPYLDAVKANTGYLKSLEPDRLLHNFRLYAGLEPKGEIYGGWEEETIAGHTLGHYLTACALMHAQTGDRELRDRAVYIVDQLAECQAAAGDGYVAGFTRKNEAGEIESGRRAMEEIAAGDIRPAKFYINGSWAPFYNWHKLFSGLYAAHQHCDAIHAIPVAERLGGYVEGVFAPLDDAQVQEVLRCEHGGINESFAELYEFTGNARWLALAERIYHREVLDPLAAKRDELAYIHANTQIPKLIGLARLHRITSEQRYGTASKFFWETVTGHRSYVIGGNSDREYFQEPNSISKYITEQTCESCNTYNMMKLTRGLYRERPDARYFDYYERAHINHILAQHRLDDGMFAYMVPLMSGSARAFSTPTDSFWCCVGSGMESHAKHGDSVYWRDRDGLYVNLFVPSRLDWADRGAEMALETDFPYGETVRLRVADLDAPQAFRISMRAPAWCDRAELSVNGEPVSEGPKDGYFSVHREWAKDDVLELKLPMALRFEPTPDDPQTVALLYGPLVLAADLGPADEPWDAPAPALVGDDLLAAFARAPGAAAEFRSKGIGRPGDMTFRPFHEQTDRRTAVYFKRYTPAEWAAAEEAFAAEAARLAELERRSVDSITLGDEASETAHDLDSDISYAVEYRNRKGRDARTGGFFAFDFDVSEAEDGPLVLQAAYWGGERERAFDILVDDQKIATDTLEGPAPGEWVTRDYPVPAEVLEGKKKVRVRFSPHDGHTAGPSFGVRIYRPSA